MIFKAFRNCPDKPTEGLILSAMVSIKEVHDKLMIIDLPAEFDPEEYCSAV